MAQNSGDNVQESTEIMQFPCDYGLKVFGLESDFFEAHVLEILRPLCPQDTCFTVKKNVSKKAKYQSLTISFTAHSREQMDDIYQALKDSEHVVMSL